MQIIKGDLFNHIEKNSIIVHGVNCIGKWGKGFVLPLAQRFPQSRLKYLEKFRNSGWSLGSVQILSDQGVFIANCATQKDIYGYKMGRVDADYNAIETCLEKVIIFSNKNNLQILMPKIGCGLAGGDWIVVKSIIETLEKKYQINIKIFEL